MYKMERWGGPGGGSKNRSLRIYQFQHNIYGMGYLFNIKTNIQGEVNSHPNNVIHSTAALVNNYLLNLFWVKNERSFHSSLLGLCFQQI